MASRNGRETSAATPSGAATDADLTALSDEAFARDLRELRLWLNDVEPINGGQGWRYRVLNFYWMDKFRTVAREAERRTTALDTAPQPSPGRNQK